MMTFKYIPSHYYLDYKFLTLATPHLQGEEFSVLEKLADFECTNFLKQKSLIPDPLGNSILRYQIYKNFYSHTNYNIFLRSNIFDLIDILNNIIPMEELQIPFELQNIDSIYNFLNEKVDEIENNEKKFYILDIWGLEYQKIKTSKLIIFSSIEFIYGVQNINLCWCAARSKSDIALIQNILERSGPSCSSFSEIYSLITLRNSNLINSKNHNLLLANKKIIEKYISNHRKFEMKISGIYSYAILKHEKPNDLMNFAEKNYSLILSTDDKIEHIYIHFGKRKFGQEFSVLQDILENF